MAKLEVESDEQPVFRVETKREFRLELVLSESIPESLFREETKRESELVLSESIPESRVELVALSLLESVLSLDPQLPPGSSV